MVQVPREGSILSPIFTVTQTTLPGRVGEVSLPLERMYPYSVLWEGQQHHGAHLRPLSIECSYHTYIAQVICTEYSHHPTLHIPL